MSSQHTPGPWEARISGGYVECLSQSPFGIVATISAPECKVEDGEYARVSAANARLIAEAPDLFDLVEDLAALDASAAPLNETSAEKLIERAVALVKRIRQSTTRPPDIREA